MAEKLGSNSGTRVIDLSVLVGVNQEIQENIKTEVSYFKTTVGYLELIYSKLSKTVFGTVPGGTGSTGFSKINANYQPAEKKTVTAATSMGKELGGMTGKAAGVALEAAGGVAGNAIGTAIGTAILPGIGTMVGSLVGGLIDAGLSEWKTANEDKEMAFKDELNARYSAVQNRKSDSIQSGSEIAMEKEAMAVAGTENSNNTLRAKMEELEALQSGVDEIAGEEYNKKLEESLDAKINFIKENKTELENIYAAMGQNAGNDEAAKINSEVASMEDLLKDKDFLSNLKAGNSYVIEERYLASLANAENIYDQTDAAKAMNTMNLDTYRHIGADMIYTFEEQYDNYEKKFNDFGQDDARKHQEFLVERLMLSHMDKETAKNIRQQGNMDSANEYRVNGGGLYQPRDGGYYMERLIKGKGYNYSGVTDFSYKEEGYSTPSVTANSEGQTQPSAISAPPLPTSVAAYVPTGMTTHNSEKQPVNQTNNYNANVNIEKMEVMDRAMVQTIVDEMFNALTLAYKNTPQVVNY